MTDNMTLSHWDIVIASFIAAIPPTIAATATLIVAIKTHVVAVSTNEIAKETTKAVEQTTKAVNGILGARVEAAKAEGRLDEQHDQKERERKSD